MTPVRGASKRRRSEGVTRPAKKGLVRSGKMEEAGVDEACRVTR